MLVVKEEELRAKRLRWSHNMKLFRLWIGMLESVSEQCKGTLTSRAISPQTPLRPLPVAMTLYRPAARSSLIASILSPPSLPSQSLRLLETRLQVQLPTDEVDDILNEWFHRSSADENDEAGQAETYDQYRDKYQSREDHCDAERCDDRDDCEEENQNLLESTPARRLRSAF